jgi:hypothetical protein
MSDQHNAYPHEELSKYMLAQQMNNDALYNIMKVDNQTLDAVAKHSLFAQTIGRPLLDIIKNNSGSANSTSHSANSGNNSVSNSGGNFANTQHPTYASNQAAPQQFYPQGNAINQPYTHGHNNSSQQQYSNIPSYPPSQQVQQSNQHMLQQYYNQPQPQPQPQLQQQYYNQPQPQPQLQQQYYGQQTQSTQQCNPHQQVHSTHSNQVGQPSYPGSYSQTQAQNHQQFQFSPPNTSPSWQSNQAQPNTPSGISPGKALLSLVNRPPPQQQLNVPPANYPQYNREQVMHDYQHFRRGHVNPAQNQAPQRAHTNMSPIVFNAIISKLFKRWDRDGSNSIDINEFPGMLTELFQNTGQQAPSQEEMFCLMMTFDTDNSGTLEFSEWRDMCKELFNIHN